MSCAQFSAIVATLKSQNPSWSLSAIRSAIMTTAFQQSNSKSRMIVNSANGEYLATPNDFGAGVATTCNSSALQAIMHQQKNSSQRHFLRTFHAVPTLVMTRFLT